MKLIILLLVICFATPCYAALYRYTDIATGEERGICYGHTPPVNNPDWNVEIIDESFKKQYMAKHRGERNAKKKIRKDEKKQKKDKVIKKLEDFGFDAETIEGILN